MTTPCASPMFAASWAASDGIASQTAQLGVRARVLVRRTDVDGAEAAARKAVHAR